jgi:uncharacterized protein DUF6585
MAATGLGYAEHRFGQNLGGRLILALGVIVALVFVWATPDVASPSAHPELLWISAGLVIAGVLGWIAISKTVLTINEQGVRRESVFGVQEIPWGAIKETRYRVVPINVYAHFGLVGALIAMSSKSAKANLTLELISNDGKRLKVTSNFSNAKDAIGLILSRVLPPMVKDAQGRLQRGETVKFGDLALSAAQVSWKNKTTIPISEVEKAEIVGSYLQLKRRGKWLSAIKVQSYKVPNVLVFLEVLEALAPQVKSAGIDPLARVRL